MNRNQRRILFLLSAFWLFTAVYYANQPLAWALMFNKPVVWMDVLLAATQWLFCIPVSLFCLMLPAHYSLKSENRSRNIRSLTLIGLAVCAAFLAYDIVCLYLYGLIQNFRPEFTELVRKLLISRAHTYLLVYVLLTALAYALDTFKRAKESEEEASRHALKAAELKRDLVEARLQALRMQLQPHFIFNAHHAIIGLMLNGEKDKAVSMLTHLSDLLRLTLDQGETLLVSLGQELDLLRQYLEIQQIRFGDRLQVTIETPVDLLSAEVPSLILQPLVENAVKHGIEKHIAAGNIRISAQRADERLILAVENSGQNVEPAARPSRNGIGLSSTIARLQQTYGDQQSFCLCPRPQGGMKAELIIPLRHTSDSDGKAEASFYT